ncbi:MAG: GntR family transcriptional regulator [Lachnospiraceae bacterium]|nr:GntR family transcriptional regulator [Lachnospiraceae bacterium]
MISFTNFILEDGIPIYLQIIRHMKQGIVARTIEDGDELPSRRVLSALLGVNPNTIQKAYKLLEEEGLIQSHSGAKSYMVLSPESIDKIRTELLENDAKNAVKMLKQMGVTMEEAMALIEKYWN